VREVDQRRARKGPGQTTRPSGQALMMLLGSPEARFPAAVSRSVPRHEPEIELVRPVRVRRDAIAVSAAQHPEIVLRRISDARPWSWRVYAVVHDREAGAGADESAYTERTCTTWPAAGLNEGQLEVALKSRRFASQYPSMA
jgi:hypothetical protein